MSTDKKISNLVEQQFPQFVRDEGPNLVAFIKAYYEWTEQANNVIDTTKSLLSYQDIDTSPDKYFEYFHREIMNSIPRDMIANKPLLAKHIKDLYRSRGSEQSYRLLFRILFNEEIEFYYPGEDILRASDGRWVQDTIIRVGSPIVGDLNLLIGNTIEGLDSGATARVERITTTFAIGTVVNELVLLDINGIFQDNETIQLLNDPTVSATIINTIGPLQDVEVTYGGAFHRADDAVSFTSTSGVNANGVVTGTTDTSAVQWNINDGGSGYTVGATVTVTGGSGTGADFVVSSIGSTEIISVNNNTIEPMKDVVLNTSPTFVSAGANTAVIGTNLAAANINTTLSAAFDFDTVTVGTITGVNVTNYGQGYLILPTATVVEEQIRDLYIPDGSGGYKGDNADITATNAPGSITSVRVNNFGQDYNRYEQVSINNLTRGGTASGLGIPFVSGVVTLPGSYRDTKGWLSWNNRLQDNYYYQEFSYEIRSDQFTNTYRELVNTILHPAGTKMFGRIRLFAEAETTVVTVDSTSLGRFVIQSDIEMSVPEVVSGGESDYVADDGAIESYPDVILDTEVETTTVTVESNVWLYSAGTGELFVLDSALLSTYSSNTIALWANTPISAMGSPYHLVGNNTVFSVEVPNPGSGLFIIDTYGPTANGLYFTNTVYSNTSLTLTTPYAGTTLANGSFYYLANTSP